MLKGIGACLTNLTVSPTQNIFQKKTRRINLLTLYVKLPITYFFAEIQNDAGILNNGFISNIPK